jgi:CheY-like chemotaxis protein
MKTNLPLVALVGNDATIVSLIGLLLGDLCRIEHHFDAVSLIENAESDPPAIVLIDIDFLASDPGSLSRRIKAASPTAGAPLIYVSVTDLCLSDDGRPLEDCLVTTRRPTEFRAIIEARLPRRTEPGS